MSTKTHRNAGEGSAPRQRPDGRWIAQLRVGTKIVDGQKVRQRKTVYGATR
ncbi:hypothetical protein [Arthrobacter sp. UCD-GKA]|uniref:hypothetical protein n=1 Tax=Arthrobacter sp. UCD-GKA TaxID=1913576 RepID=UPI00158748C3|nr:hypothetical protein [Arthrobacter sp. UCD-GKA]